MEHLALYREWRPQFFKDVIGQEHVCRTLQNAVRLERVAHAYLFCGPRGTGKTSTARILAKAVNCPNSEGGEPCNRCPSCENTTIGISLDVIEMDAASHRGIEEIRDLNQKVCFAPTAGKSRLFIIDEVHMLTGEAFNALLKTLEEPPRHIIFVLATTEAHKVPLTIVSRCQRFDFRRLGREAIREHLRHVAASEDWQIDGEALDFLSSHSRGALRDALGLLEQAASFTGGVISRAELEALTGALSSDRLRMLLAAVLAGDVPALLAQMDELFAQGCEPRQVLFQLVDQVRGRMFAAPGSEPEPAGYPALLRCLAVAEAELKGHSRPDLVLELSLLRFTDMLSDSRPGMLRAAVPGADAEAALRPATPTVQAALPEAGTMQEQATATEAAPPEQAKTPEAVTLTEQAALPEAGTMQEQAAATEAAPPEQAKTPEAALSPGPAALPEAAALTEQAKTREAETMREQAPAQAAAAEPGAMQKQEPAALQKQEPAGIDLLELKRNLGQGFQKQRFVAQALAACELEQDGNRIIMKALYDFHQEMLAKEENRHKLQEALRHHYPDLELEIVTLANPPEAAARAAAQPASQQGAGRRSPGRAADQTAPLQGATLPEGAGGSEPPPPDREAPAPFVVTPSLFDLADPDADFDAGPDTDRVAEPDAVVGAGRLAGEDAGSDSDPVGVALTLFNGEIINEKKEAD